MNSLIEIKEYSEDGFKPVIDYQSWRVAILNFCKELEIQNIDYFARHNETDEVFVLLSGKCILFLADGTSKPQQLRKSGGLFGLQSHKMEITGDLGHVTAIDMKPKKVYNVKKGVYHTHTLTKNGSVLIVENRNTTRENSDYLFINEDVRKNLLELTNTFW